MLLSPLGERLGEGVMQETIFGYPSPNLSPKGERNMTHERAWRPAVPEDYDCAIASRCSTSSSVLL